jgi:hypothetical protein
MGRTKRPSATVGIGGAGRRGLPQQTQDIRKARREGRADMRACFAYYPQCTDHLGKGK